MIIQAKTFFFNLLGTYGAAKHRNDFLQLSTRLTHPLSRSLYIETFKNLPFMGAESYRISTTTPPPIIATQPNPYILTSCLHTPLNLELIHTPSPSPSPSPHRTMSQQPNAPGDNAPEDELDPSLVKLACQNRIRNRSKRSPEWIFFADAGMWQTVNGEESKFRIANCRYCLKADIETKIRGKIETMKNHIMECDKIPASQKAVYERHPGRYKKRQPGSSTDPSKRQKFEIPMKPISLSHVDGVENRAVVLHGAGDMRIEKVPIPTLPPGHLLISMRSVGICGSVGYTPNPTITTLSQSSHLQFTPHITPSFTAV